MVWRELHFRVSALPTNGKTPVERDKCDFLVYRRARNPEEAFPGPSTKGPTIRPCPPARLPMDIAEVAYTLPARAWALWLFEEQKEVLSDGSHPPA